MVHSKRLFTPGPVSVHPVVLRAAAEPPLDHHHRAFAHLLGRVEERLQRLFRTQSPVAILTCSATGAHEAVARMLHADGGEAIVCTLGRFSHRWATLLERGGVTVHRVESPWGENIALDQLAMALGAYPRARSLWIVHSETSTGVLTPLADIAQLARQIAPDIILCVDAVSSLGIHPLWMDEWGVDIVIASSQKGVGGLPGLALVAANDRARRMMSNSPATLYFDLHAAFDALRRGTTPFTPAVTLIRALDAALELIEQEGLERRWERYRRDAQYLRRRLCRAGYRLFGEGSSYAVTVGYLPTELPNLVEILDDRYGFIIARGQEQYANVLFRIGHCGWYRRSDLRQLGDALEEVMRRGNMA